MADVTCDSIPEEPSKTTSRQAHDSSEVILENDETFFQAAHSRAPSVPLVKDTSPPPDVEDTSEQVEKMPESDDHQGHRPASSHFAPSPRSNAHPTSSPSCQPSPGVETQLGGFLEILQQRNRLVDLSDKAKEKEGRRGKKRGLEDSTRTSGNNQGEDSHSSAAVNNGLKRTMSEFSHSSTTASQLGGFLERNQFEESMDVTWEDPAAKREILKAINDPTSKTSTIRRTAALRRPSAQKHISIDSQTSSRSDKNEQTDQLVKKNHTRPGVKKKAEFSEVDDHENHRIEDALNGQDDESDEITILPPLKKRRPRLIDK
jgi:hypothetical protein